MSRRLSALSSLWHGHIDDDVSALVDGQLPGQAAERAWSHVMTCRDCRRLVDGEMRLKERLGTLSSYTSACQAPGLQGALYDVASWSAADRHDCSGSRRGVKTVVGLGSVSAAFVGVLALVGAQPADIVGSFENDSPVAAVTSDLTALVETGVGYVEVVARDAADTAGE